MIKKIASFFLLALFYGCNDINYDSQTRLVLQGEIVNRAGEPVANQAIDVAIYNHDLDSNDQEYSATDVISYGYTDGMGAFKLVFPAPKNESHRIGLRINHLGGNYQNKEFLRIKREDFTEFRLDLGSIYLYKQSEICQLFINPTTSNENHELRSVAVEGLLAERFVYHHPFETDLMNLRKAVVKGQTVKLKYEVIDHSNPEPVILTDSVNVNIGLLSELNYTLHY